MKQFRTIHLRKRDRVQTAEKNIESPNPDCVKKRGKLSDRFIMRIRTEAQIVKYRELTRLSDTFSTCCL
jgi:hypothetical protein